MATLARPRPALRADDVFFLLMSVLALTIVVVGFAESYFFAGMVLARLPNVLVHVHGALFVAWILLLVTQTALVAVHRVRWHIALGSLGVVLPPLMVIVGAFTLVDSIRRNQVGVPAELLLVGDTEELLLFAGLVTWGMLRRRNSADHKRLMILATFSILGPAVNRFHFPENLRLPGTIALVLVLPLLVVAYDLWSQRRILRSTAIATTLIEASILTLVPLTSLPLWNSCVTWIRR